MICEAVGIEFNKNLWNLRKEFRIDAIESSTGVEIERIFWNELTNSYWGQAAVVGGKALVPQDDIILVIPKPLFSIYSDLRIHKNWGEFNIPFSTTRI